jgi:hypothetical protein
MLTLSVAASFTLWTSRLSSAVSASVKVGKKMIPDVIDFKILPDYRIQVTLSNGRRGIFNVTPYLDRGIFTELKDYRYFSCAKIEYGTIVWPNKQDFSPETIEIRMEEDVEKKPIWQVR